MLLSKSPLIHETPELSQVCSDLRWIKPKDPFKLGKIETKLESRVRLQGDPGSAQSSQADKDESDRSYSTRGGVRTVEHAVWVRICTSLSGLVWLRGVSSSDETGL